VKFLRNLFGERPREPADMTEAEDEASLAAASALIVALERRDQELDRPRTAPAWRLTPSAWPCSWTWSRR
jgi:hypothetical protein